MIGVRIETVQDGKSVRPNLVLTSNETTAKGVREVVDLYLELMKKLGFTKEEEGEGS